MVWMWLMGAPAWGFDVVVHGVEGGGLVGVALFGTEQGWPNDGRKAVAAVEVPASRAKDGVVTVSFPDLDVGKVAVAVRHDLNGNNKLDTNLVGYPKEPFGFSNNAPLRTFGAPRFEDVVVSTEGSTRVDLRAP